MIIKALHITLAVLLYLSSVGITISKHFCSGELKDVAVFGQAETCDGQCSMHQGDSFEALGIKDIAPKSCCADKSSQEPKGSEENHCCDFETDYLQLDIENITVEALSFANLLPLLFIIDANLFNQWSSELLVNSQRQFQYYQPPNIILDIPILIQSFLI